VAWGYNNVGQCDVPPPNEDFMTVAAGRYHGLGMKPLGTPEVCVQIEPLTVQSLLQLGEPSVTHRTPA